MSTTINDTRTLLDALWVEIKRESFRSQKQPRRIVGWKGPGAVFMTKVKMSGGPSLGLRGEPLSVITPHAHAAGWLLDRLDLAFAPLLGSQLRWDFFERIAEASIDYSAFIPPGLDTDVNLLRIILREARDLLEEMDEGEFPYVLTGGEA
jgi:hypothetical protein